MSDLITAPYSATQNGTFDASLLNKRELDRIEKALYSDAKLAEFASGLKLSLRARELVIQQESSAQNTARVVPVPDNAEHIGSLALILDSNYTGGELEVTHNGCTEVVTGPYNWVAMYGECLHKINLVTSGTRASLLFDIYGKKRRNNGDKPRTCFETDDRMYQASPKAPDLVHAKRPPSAAQLRKIVKCLKNELMRSFVIHDITHDWCGEEPLVRLFSPDSINNAFFENSATDSASSAERVGLIMPRTNEKRLLNARKYEQQSTLIRSSVYLVSGLQISKKKV